MKKLNMECPFSKKFPGNKLLNQKGMKPIQESGFNNAEIPAYKRTSAMPDLKKNDANFFSS